MEQDFDQFAHNYRNTHTQSIKRVAGADSYYFAWHKVNELRKFETDKTMAVLDLGCGDGATALYMSTMFPGFKITGIDISKESIDVAKEREIPNAEFLWYDGNQIPFPDNSFQIIFIAGVLHHVPLLKREALLCEVERVLQKGGRLYLFEHNPYNPLTKYLVNTCVFDKGVELLKAKEAKKLVIKSGLTVEEIRYIIFFPRSPVFKILHKTESLLAHFFLGGQYYIRGMKKH